MRRIFEYSKDSRRMEFATLDEELKRRGIDLSHIDEPVRPLIYALNSRGYWTYASCGGHDADEAMRRNLMYRPGTFIRDRSTCEGKPAWEDRVVQWAYFSEDENGFHLRTKEKVVKLYGPNSDPEKTLGHASFQHHVTGKKPWVFCNIGTERMTITPEEAEILERTIAQYSSDARWTLRPRFSDQIVISPAGDGDAARADVRAFAAFLYETLSDRSHRAPQEREKPR